MDHSFHYTVTALQGAKKLRRQSHRPPPLIGWEELDISAIERGNAAKQLHTQSAYAAVDNPQHEHHRC